MPRPGVQNNPENLLDDIARCCPGVRGAVRRLCRDRGSAGCPAGLITDGCWHPKEAAPAELRVPQESRRSPSLPVLTRADGFTAEGPVRVEAKRRPAVPEPIGRSESYATRSARP